MKTRNLSKDATLEKFNLLKRITTPIFSRTSKKFPLLTKEGSKGWFFRYYENCKLFNSEYGIIIIFIFLFLILNVKTAFPQDKTKQESPSITYKDEKGNSVQLKVSSLKVDVKVVGKLAVTTMDITYSNSADRVLEGELNFPLSEGQSVSRFAMEINGKLREGVVVEKEKGRQVFESIVRQRIDPALLEMTRGNSFKSRVYPIPAKGIKRVVIAYEETLPENVDGMTYRLPLAYPEPIDTFRLTATVYGDCSILKSQTNGLDYSEFRKTGSAYVTAVEYINYKADKQFEFMIASPENRRDAMTETIGGITYFAIDLIPKITASPAIAPKNLCIFWDVSGSGAAREIKTELALLKNYLGKINPEKLTVVTFANEIIDSKVFNISNGNSDNLTAYLQERDYDGGTRLSAIDPAKYPADVYLLFTDGISNFGKSGLKTFSKPIYIINSNQNAEHDALRYYAQKSGGAYLNLLNLDENAAVNMLTNQTPSFISAEVLSGDAREIYPSIQTPFSGSFLITGQMNSNAVKIKLNFGSGGIITKSVTIDLDKESNKTQTGLLGRIWAQKKLAELNMQYEKNKDAITALGKEYSIVTKNTSLIVLDRVEDYARYQIEPPEELKADYDKLIAEMTKDTEKDSITHFKDVVRMFNGEKKWWGKEITYTFFYFDNSYWRGTNTFVYPNSNERLIDISESENKEGNGILLGSIKDQSGHGLVGSVVRISSNKKGSISNNKFGFYTIPNLKPGVYEVFSSCFGLDTVRTKVNITANEITRQDFHLNYIPNVNSMQDVFQRENRQNETIILNSELDSYSSESSELNSAFSPVQSSSGSDLNDPLSPSSTPRRNQTAGVEVMSRQSAEGGEGVDLGGYAPNIEFSENNRRVRAGDKNSGNYVTKQSISLTDYISNAPYMKKLSAAAAQELYKSYLVEKRTYGNNPGFYLDVSQLFLDKGDSIHAVRVLSNVAEMQLENQELMRILGHRLQQIGKYDLSESVFRDVLQMRGEEPQSYRDLALVLSDAGKYQEAADLLYHAAMTKWDFRFPEVELIALNELNRIIALHPGDIDATKYAAELIKKMPVDIRIVMNWDTDNCDIDLWVYDPTGEPCNYTHRMTAVGGKLSSDFTGGYGPEEFMLHNAVPGKYRVEAKYYGSRSQKLLGETTVQLELYIRYSTGDEVKKVTTVRLQKAKDTQQIGEFEF